MAKELPEYDFTLPSSGIALKWRPIRVGTSLAISTQFPNANQAAHRQAALLAARIFMFNGEAKPTGMSFGQIQVWEDELDLTAFSDHVVEQEAIRAMVLRKRGHGATVGAKEAFMAGIEELQTAAERMQSAIGVIITAAEMMRSEFDPLGSAPSST